MFIPTKHAKFATFHTVLQARFNHMTLNEWFIYSVYNSIVGIFAYLPLCMVNNSSYCYYLLAFIKTGYFICVILLVLVGTTTVVYKSLFENSVSVPVAVKILSTLHCNHFTFLSVFSERAYIGTLVFFYIVLILKVMYFDMHDKILSFE